jgi:hypothetical protein
VLLRLSCASVAFTAKQQVAPKILNIAPVFPKIVLICLTLFYIDFSILLHSMIIKLYAYEILTIVFAEYQIF